MAGKKKANRYTYDQKLKIIAEYAASKNANKVAQKYGIAHTTLLRWTYSMPEMHAIAQQKQEECLTDMFEFMESRKGVAQLFIDKCMEELLAPGKLKKAQVNQITTAMGTVFDKFTASTKVDDKALEQARALLETINSKI